MNACGCHRTTQPSLYPGQAIVFARSLIFLMPYWIKCKFQEKKNVFMASGFGKDVGKLLRTPNSYSSPSQHLNAVVFWIHRWGRIPKLVFTIRKLEAWRGLFRMKQAKGPPICWSYWASHLQGSSMRFLDLSHLSNKTSLEHPVSCALPALMTSPYLTSVPLQFITWFSVFLLREICCEKAHLNM